jgi:hypothetical protein
LQVWLRGHGERAFHLYGEKRLVKMHDLAKGGGRKCWHLEHFQEYACMYIIMHGGDAIFSNLVISIRDSLWWLCNDVIILYMYVCWSGEGLTIFVGCFLIITTDFISSCTSSCGSFWKLQK